MKPLPNNAAADSLRSPLSLISLDAGGYVIAVANIDAEREALWKRALLNPESTAFADLMATLQPEDGALASGFYRRLTEWIQKFEEGLDAEHEVGARLVSFGQAVTFHLENISYWNPSLILFQGSTDTGDPVQLIQHVSQISLLLMKLPRATPAAQSVASVSASRTRPASNNAAADSLRSPLSLISLAAV